MLDFSKQFPNSFDIIIDIFLGSNTEMIVIEKNIFEVAHEINNLFNRWRNFSFWKFKIIDVNIEFFNNKGDELLELLNHSLT
jgi:hypothetical protein